MVYVNSNTLAFPISVGLIIADWGFLNTGFMVVLGTVGAGAVIGNAIANKLWDI